VGLTIYAVVIWTGLLWIFVDRDWKRKGAALLAVVIAAILGFAQIVG